MCACVCVCRHLVVQVQQVPNRELNLSLHPSSSQEEDWQVGSLLPPPVCVLEIVKLAVGRASGHCLWHA